MALNNFNSYSQEDINIKDTQLSMEGKTVIDISKADINKIIEQVVGTYNAPGRQRAYDFAGRLSWEEYKAYFSNYEAHFQEYKFLLLLAKTLEEALDQYIIQIKSGKSDLRKYQNDIQGLIANYLGLKTKVTITDKVDGETSQMVLVTNERFDTLMRKASKGEITGNINRDNLKASGIYSEFEYEVMISIADYIAAWEFHQEGFKLEAACMTVYITYMLLLNNASLSHLTNIIKNMDRTQAVVKEFDGLKTLEERERWTEKMSKELKTFIRYKDFNNDTQLLSRIISIINTKDKDTDQMKVLLDKVWSVMEVKTGLQDGFYLRMACAINGKASVTSVFGAGLMNKKLVNILAGVNFYNYLKFLRSYIVSWKFILTNRRTAYNFLDDLLEVSPYAVMDKFKTIFIDTPKYMFDFLKDNITQLYRHGWHGNFKIFGTGQGTADLSIQKIKLDRNLDSFRDAVNKNNTTILAAQKLGDPKTLAELYSLPPTEQLQKLDLYISQIRGQK